MTSLTITKKDDAKGRSFTVELVAEILVPGIVPQPQSSTRRPALLAYAGTPSALKAFTVNLRCGEVAAGDDRTRYELLRSLGYRYETQSTPAGQLCIAYLPELLHFKPGAAETNAIRFLSAPCTWWLDAQEPLLRSLYGEQARQAACALAFVARLDQRTALPIANQPAFHLALYNEALEQPWTAETATDGLRTQGLDALGLEHPILCDVAPATFSEFLSDFTATHLQKEAFHGTTRFAGDRGLLPDAASPYRQLQFDLFAPGAA